MRRVFFPKYAVADRRIAIGPNRVPRKGFGVVGSVHHSSPYARDGECSKLRWSHLALGSQPVIDVKRFPAGGGRMPRSGP